MRKALAALAVAHAFAETADAAVSIMELVGLDWSLAASSGSLDLVFNVVGAALTLFGI